MTPVDADGCRWRSSTFDAFAPPRATFGSIGDSAGHLGPPASSVIDQHGRLSIAKFLKETDEYSMESNTN